MWTTHVSSVLRNGDGTQELRTIAGPAVLIKGDEKLGLPLWTRRRNVIVSATSHCSHSHTETPGGIVVTTDPDEDAASSECASFGMTLAVQYTRVNISPALHIIPREVQLAGGKPKDPNFSEI
ncbi:hypothetical protein EI94DRAFT_975365 [Lactarius quietus]|nr:hypothetical protein EI94DRAFT_975365 [Lactarius quietus]